MSKKIKIIEKKQSKQKFQKLEYKKEIIHRMYTVPVSSFFFVSSTQYL